MRLAWAGIVAAAVGLVMAGLLWAFAVVTFEGTPPSTCYGRGGLEVSCEVLGFDMRYGGVLAAILIVASGLIALAAIRTGQGRRRRPRNDV